MAKLIKISAPVQPINNAHVQWNYLGDELVSIRIKAEDGFELVKGEAEQTGIIAVDIPASCQGSVTDYRAVAVLNEE